MQWDVVVVGAGAAGLMAAARSAQRGRHTLLLEKNTKPGAKILMSGGSRCNITQATDGRGIVEAFGRQGTFLHSALAALSPADLIALFESEGVATKTEDTGKIFPASNKAMDVLAALRRRLERSGCELALGEPLVKIAKINDAFRLSTDHRQITAEKVIVTTGGKSYPGCGTSGDGYPWLTQLGHRIIKTRPALTPVTTNLSWIAALRGMTLPDVAVRVVVHPDHTDQSNKKQRPLAATRGSFLFTHFGFSGPAVLDVSRAITRHVARQTLALECDFLPAMRESDLDEHLRRCLSESGRKQLDGLIVELLPRRLAESLVSQLGFSGRKAAEVSKADRRKLVSAIKRHLIPVSGTCGFEKAEVTAGGVSLAEIDSRTMQSKIVPQLFLAGEILDLDGPIGGYNFQAAFSGGWLAGSSV